MEKFIVVMAGGVGSRFWPRSRKAMPKQLLNIFGENSMIQDTVDRLEGYVPLDKIFIVTNKIQKAIIEEQLPSLPKKNIIAEPIGRNTAPCVGVAAKVINDISKGAVFATLPADHLIKDKEKFQKTLEKAFKFAYEKKGLVTFGIEPTRPDTGYGYINYDKEEMADKIFKVKKFVEKPNLETAQSYLDSGDYLWNSGMFVWRADVILEEMEKYLGETYEEILKLSSLEEEKNFEESLARAYDKIKGISIDYGIMEKSDKVYLVKGEFDWSDVGSWETVYELSPKDEFNNHSHGDTFLKNTKNSYVYSPNKFAAAIGLDNVVIIDTVDALLVCDKNHSQDIKYVVEYLNNKGKEDLT